MFLPATDGICSADRHVLYFGEVQVRTWSIPSWNGDSHSAAKGPVGGVVFVNGSTASNRYEQVGIYDYMKFNMDLAWIHAEPRNPDQSLA